MQSPLALKENMIVAQEKLILENLKPISINSFYGSNQYGKYKTSDAVEWTCQVFHLLSSKENQENLKKIRELFHKDEHSYGVRLVAYYPKEKFFTKAGDISSHTVDCTNWEKPLVDCLFLPKYYDVPSPEGCNNLNVDDKVLTELSSSKKPGDCFRIEIEIVLLKRDIQDNID